uniref:SRCR domain-containing protein n=1 Tax=Dicentrarchus labrax TaxID=13489 RepID=A0A8C4F1B9_DICLA
MWFLLLLLYIAHIELVYLQGDVNRLILRNKNGRNPCEGHIEIYHNGVQGYVGDKYWSNKTEEVVCRSTHCGSPESRDHSTDVLKPKGSKVWLNELKCEGNESQLWNCKNPGWGVSKCYRDTIKWIKCSNEINIMLEGYECAGMVKYSSVNERGYFCSNNWGNDQANRLCKNLGCGESKEIPKKEWMDFSQIKTSKMMMIDCSGLNETNLWQCAAQKEKQKCETPATVICTGFMRLQLKGDEASVCSGMLEKEEDGGWKPVDSSSKSTPDVWCKQMDCGTNVSNSFKGRTHHLECSDKVQVVLKDSRKISKCYGEVHIQVNGSDYPVCGSSWDLKTAGVVCKELKCGAVVDQYTRSGTQSGIMDNVECTGNESSLWHCRGKHNKNAFQCPKKAFVVCAESVKVRLADGPGRCAGRVEIEHEGKWKRVSSEKWEAVNSNIICNELDCGGARSGNSETFSEGSAEFLTKSVSCSSGASRIHECIKASTSSSRPENSMMITCEGHKVVFLNNTCSGMVGIQHGSKTYWLSGSNNTWNQESAHTVCKQMQCGDAYPYEYIPSADMKRNVWQESYNCYPNNTSLFDCKKNKTLPSDHNDSIAVVKCSGAISVNLTNGCWGTVNVCVGGKCGGVCKDSWTKEKSVMLCKDIGCGNKILSSSQKNEAVPIVRSLHTTTHTTNLSQCNFIKNDEYGPNVNFRCELASVICSDSVKARISASRHKCSGNVEVHYEGTWLPVCSDALKDQKTQNAICEEVNCGHAVKQLNYFGPTSKIKNDITQIQCSNSDIKSLTECDIVSEKHGDCPLAGLQCSNWSKMELKFDGACSGAVFAHSETGRNAVSIEGWTKTEMDKLCNNLECGNLKSNRTYVSDQEQSQTLPSQKQQKEQLWIECQDEPKVTLSKKCGGEVRMNNIRVCSSNWNLDYSHMVCQQQDCSNAINFTIKTTTITQDKSHHVSCEGYHHRLGQCSRYEDNCDGGLVSVFCVGSVKVNTTEKCGGVIQVNYINDKWEEVCHQTSNDHLNKLLCKELGCGDPRDKKPQKKQKSNRKKSKVTLETALNCTKDHKDIKYCVNRLRCDTEKPAEIYCEGYVDIIDKDKPQSTPVVPIILGVGFLLFLVILIVVFVRVYIAKKGKKSMNVPSRMFSRQEPDLEFDSGDYEDVTNKANEMEDFSRGRFRSEAEVIMESDARSTSSLPYDDIDEVVETLPLTSQASGGRYIHDGALDQSSGKF